MNKLIPMLLKFDGYPPGVLVALLLHGILIYIFMPKEFEPADRVTIQPMAFVVASAVKQSPQQARRIQQLSAQRRSEEADQQRRRDAERQRQQQAAEAEQQKQAEVARQREAERQRVADEEEQKREREEEQKRVAEEQERERQRAAEREQQLAAQRAAEEAASIAAANANAQQQSVENQMISQYMAIIHDLVSNAWSRSPDAKNGMVAVVQLRLTPTGEIVQRSIVQSSGSATFDSSVLQAVDRVGAFPELKEMPTPIFERNFRTFNLEFSPEDLLR
jgi:colicin import membrane protein